MEKALNLLWTDTAIVHLESAWNYIAADAPPYADAQLSRILDAVERIAQFPELGRTGRIRGTRELVVPGTPFLIAYRVHRNEIQILAILHGARRWPDAL